MILHTLHVFHGGCARTGVRERSLPGVSKRTLVQRLCEMEASGLIHRDVVEPVRLLYD